MNAATDKVSSNLVADGSNFEKIYVGYVGTH